MDASLARTLESSVAWENDVPTVFADQSFVLQNSHRVEFPIDDAIRTTDFFFLHVWDYRDSYTNGLFDIILKTSVYDRSLKCKKAAACSPLAKDLREQ